MAHLDSAEPTAKEETAPVLLPPPKPRHPPRKKRRPQTNIVTPKKAPGGSRAHSLEEIPVGWHTRKQICYRVGITALQLNVLIAQGHVTAGKMLEGGKPLFDDDTLAQILNKKKDGTLRRLLNGQVEKRNTQKNVATPLQPSSPIVDLFPTEYTVDQGIEAAKMLYEGKDPIAIAIALRIHLPVVRQIIFDVCDIGKAAFIPQSILEQMNAVTNLPGVYPMRSATDVLEMLKSCAEARRCPSCQKGTCADECAACIEDRTVRALELRAQRDRERREAAARAAAAAASAPASPPDEGGDGGAAAVSDQKSLG